MPRMLRPKATVLPDSALVPGPGRGAKTGKANIPGPTHEVIVEQPYYLASENDVVAGARADGHLRQKARVSMLRSGAGPLCRVEDQSGRQVTTALAGLRPLR